MFNLRRAILLIGIGGGVEIGIKFGLHVLSQAFLVRKTLRSLIL